MVTGWQGSVESGVLELRVAVHAFSLPAGVLGYVSRPGVAGYETVSVVSGTGSDLSVRTRMRIGTRARLTVYAGMPRSGESRTYVALALEL